MPFHPSNFLTLPESLRKLSQKIVQDLNPTRIILFGSRARGDHRPDSDFDLCLEGASPNPADRARMRLALTEEPITLYKVDLVFWDELNEEYIQNIGREGKVLYER